MKKILSILLSAGMLLSLLSACSPSGTETATELPAVSEVATASPAASTENDEDAGIFTPGTYSSTQQGHNGTVTVDVTFTADSIQAVEVGEHSETAGVADPALERIPEAVVSGQTLAVDTVSGATVTSAAILAGVEDCIRQAGADPAAFMEAANGEAERVSVERDEEVVVVGTGIAGLMAAVNAADGGAKVLAIDKMPITGGTSRTAGGYLISVDSSLNKGESVDGIAATMDYWHDLMEQGGDTGYPNYDKVKDVLGESGAVVDHMIAMGVPFNPDVVNIFGAYPVAFVDGGGSVMMDALEKAAREKGVEILLDCTAQELIVEDGAVVGVLAATATEDISIRAKSVVLATGGMSQNPEMVAAYSPEITEVVSLASVGSTGDGIRMAEAAGAGRFNNYWSSLSGMATSEEYRRAVPDAAALTTAAQLGVNAEGVRYASENPTQHTSLTYASIVDGNYPHYFIYDASNADLVAALEQGIDLGEVFVGDTPEALAEAAGMPAETFVATLARYNELAAAGKDSDFDKDGEKLVPIAEGPYYAVTFYPTTFGSMGGVMTDEKTGAVLREDGTAIPNLFAAGEMSNRDFYNQHYALAASLGFYAVMGQRSGIAAAENALQAS